MNQANQEPCELAEIVHKKPLSGEFEEVLFGSDSGNTLWIKFSDKEGIKEWIGKFGTGGSASVRVDKVVEPDKFLVSAGGFAYLLDATNRKLLNYHFQQFAQDVAYDPQSNRFVIADFVRLRLVESGKVVWTSKRIALDGIRDLKIEGRKIRGLAVTNYEGDDHHEKESSFTFDMDTLEVNCPVDFSSWDDTPKKLFKNPPAKKTWWKFW